jgi:dUTP pyrophosphatase
MASKGIGVANSPGTIDSSYRGEIKVILVNHGSYPYELRPNDKIAQMVLNEVHQVVWQEVDELDITSRHENGFGSTGK